MASDNDSNYKVGYKRPPRDSRFSKGRSGNLKGRPRGSKNIRDVLERTLSKRLFGHVNGRRTSMTTLEAVLKQLAHKAALGDLNATKLLLDICKSLPDPPKEGRVFKIVFDKGDEGI